MDLDFLLKLTKQISEIGIKKHDPPKIHLVKPFRHFFTKSGNIIYSELNDFDGKFTRREILARYLLLNVVLDQGPDMIGVEMLLREVTNYLYRKEIRIFHRPLDFFKELGISINEILVNHNSIKKIRAEIWAKDNNSNPNKYNLFFAQSPNGVIASKQVLDYSIHRWGVPLCLPLLMEKNGSTSNQPLVDYLESFNSAEIMSKELKSNCQYGLGSAIGNKACHLFAKYYISIFKLVFHRLQDTGWTKNSYELPFDSNVGRILFRTGFILQFTDIKNLKNWNVIQIKKPNEPKYIRVTNMRKRKIKSKKDLLELYKFFIKSFLKTKKYPRSIEIQHIPNLLILLLNKSKFNYSIADFDDGLMYIGTNFCFNNESPKCQICPINNLCRGFNKNNDLIKKYKT